MQWSGPNIQLQSCQYNKNEKKLKYLVKPHERFQYGFLFVVMTFFGKNPICNTVNECFLRILDLLDLLIVFYQILITTDFQNVVLQVLSVGILWRTYFRQENHMISSFNLSLLFVVVDYSRVKFLPVYSTRSFLPIKRYPKRELTEFITHSYLKWRARRTQATTIAPTSSVRVGLKLDKKIVIRSKFFLLFNTQRLWLIWIIFLNCPSKNLNSSSKTTWAEVV